MTTETTDWSFITSTLTVACCVIAISAAVVAIVWIVSRQRREHAALVQKTALELAQRGLPLPPQLLANTGIHPQHRDLRTGLVLMALGVGIISFAFTLADHPAWGLGLIPLFAGLGFLLTYVVSKWQQSSSGRP